MSDRLGQRDPLQMDDTLRLVAEALAAVTGVQRILDTPPKPVSPADGKHAVALAKQIETIFREFLSSPSFKRQKDDLPDLDYLETLDKLTRPVQPDQREKLLENFQDEQAGLAYLNVCDRGVAWLLERLPRRSRTTLVGDIPVEPSLTEMADFERDWQVAADPLQVLRDMSEGIMIGTQVDAFKTLFPTLYARTALSLQGVLLDLRGKDDTWEPPSEKAWQCMAFFGISPVDPDLATKLQAQSHAAVMAGEQQGQPSLNIDINGPDSATPNQKLANA